MVSTLIESIACLQSSESDFFLSGQFPSVRKNDAFHYVRPDSNTFGTASTLFILNQIKELLSDENKLLLEDICQKGISSFSKYLNKDGLATYNFWQTKPSQHFPNGKFMYKYKHFKLPDDIDDTSLIYEVKGYDTKDVNWLKKKLMNHADINKVYSTWFGENMPVEHDVSALCNLMYLVFEANAKFNITLNGHDIATLKHLNEVITSGQYLTKTFWVSRHYATVPLIVYHYARLLGQFEISHLAAAKKQLVEKIPGLFQKETEWMNKVLLQTAWHKLKGEDKAIEIEKWSALDFEIEDFDIAPRTKGFYSFIGAPFAPFNNAVSRFFASQKIAQIGWKCEAHELALVLENHILRDYQLDK